MYRFNYQCCSFELANEIDPPYHYGILIHLAAPSNLDFPEILAPLPEIWIQDGNINKPYLVRAPIKCENIDIFQFNCRDKLILLFFITF